MIEFACNGRPVLAQAEVEDTLADVLRDRLGLTGTKVGCGTGDCGACTVLLDGEAVCSCLVLAVRCGGREVTTVEGVVQTDLGRSLVDSFAEHHAVQCGICSPGLIVAAASLIEEAGGDLDRHSVEQGLAGNLCRCTGYQPIVAAVLAAAEAYASGRAAS
jgi:carbon-monoxide dehydrogenase small subunit